MAKRPTLTGDLGTIESRAFKSKIAADLIRQLHHLLSVPEHERDAAWIDLLRVWMLIPYTLWPADISGLTAAICAEYAQGKPLLAQVRRILGNITHLPSQQLMDVVAEDEHELKVGNYDQFLTDIAFAKYYAAEKELLCNPEVHIAIAEFFACNPDFGLGKKVIRRRMSMERNFRPYRWEYDPTDPKNVTQLEFDTLCYRFQLFGVERMPEGIKPLLQKLTVNTTGWGLDIFIPRYWSFDHKRDVNWSELMKIQRNRAVRRRGDKGTGIFTNENALNAYSADQEALIDLKLRGDARFAYVEARAKLPRMSRRNLQKLITMGKELQKTAATPITSNPA